ncbi:MAG: hypothetical protein HN356_05580 [Calditrichaeota bacterium]|nr:hypothetical protein [Calditrichota bacterium]MBT5426159.1 hypothetical protein [Bacteroidota bacterium]
MFRLHLVIAILLLFSLPIHAQFLYSENGRRISQPILQNDSTLTFISFRDEEISRIDVQLNKIHNSHVKEIKLIDICSNRTSNRTNAPLPVSRDNLILKWWLENGANGEPNCQLYNLDKGMLFPEIMTGDSENFILFKSLLNGNILSDYNGGFYIFTRFYSTPPKHFHDQSDDVTRDGSGFLYLNHEGDLIREGVVQVFSSKHKKGMRYGEDVFVFDRKSGYWIMKQNSDSTAIIQHVYNDLSFQFKDGPRQFPIPVEPRSVEMAVTPSGEIFVLRVITPWQKQTTDLELYKIDGELELIWDSPVKVFENELSGRTKRNHHHPRGYSSTLLPRKDGGAWIIVYKEEFDRDKKIGTWSKIPEYDRYYEITVQLITADGEIKITDEKAVIAHTNSWFPLDYNWGLVDSDDGLWVFWHDYEDNFAKATYISADGTFRELWTKDGINISDQPDVRLKTEGQLLMSDNTVLICLSTKQGEFLLRLEP